MRKVLYNILFILLLLVVIGKISNWFLDYGDKTNEILNSAMFILLGIVILAFSFRFKDNIKRIVFVVSGIYLIVMNFIPYFKLRSIIGIVCVLVPLLILRFSRVKKEKLAN